MRNAPREVPVYLFTGIIESGKTSFINDTLNDPGFVDGGKILLIVCEEGIEEYDAVKLSKKNIFIETVEKQESLNKEFFKKCDEFHNPSRVMIEYNGIWPMEALDEDDMPEEWMLVQVISTVDFTTYNLYWNNMRPFLMEQLKLSDMIIMNRCTDQTKKNEFRRNVKLFNKKAQIGYEAAEGFENALKEEELPYDINSNEIVLDDDDYGIWFMDVMDDSKKYDGKTITFHALVYKPPKYPNTVFVPGRFTMTCCADDIQFMGMICKSKDPIEFEDREWVLITAKIRREFVKEYRGKGPVLHLIDIKRDEKPDDDLVYF